MLWPLLQLGFLLLSPAYMPDAAPVVKWTTEKEHDFGNLKQGWPETFTFRFKNVYSDTILLETVRTTCGCTAANWTETPIAPGQEGQVRVEYDAYQGGDFDKKIRVFFNAQRKPEILRIRGTVK